TGGTGWGYRQYRDHLPVSKRDRFAASVSIPVSKACAAARSSSPTATSCTPHQANIAPFKTYEEGLVGNSSGHGAPSRKALTPPSLLDLESGARAARAASANCSSPVVRASRTSRLAASPCAMPHRQGALSEKVCGTEKVFSQEPSASCLSTRCRPPAEAA